MLRCVTLGFNSVVRYIVKELKFDAMQMHNARLTTNCEHLCNIT